MTTSRFAFKYLLELSSDVLDDAVSRVPQESKLKADILAAVWQLLGIAYQVLTSCNLAGWRCHAESLYTYPML